MAMYDVVGYNSQGMFLEEARKFEHNKWPCKMDAKT